MEIIRQQFLPVPFTFSYTKKPDPKFTYYKNNYDFDDRSAVSRERISVMAMVAIGHARMT